MYRNRAVRSLTVSLSEESKANAWIAERVARFWPGACLSAISPLKGDASTRRFWRISLQAAPGGPASVIAMDLGPDDLPLYARALRLLPEPLPEPPWLNLHRFLTKIGAAVPLLYDVDAAARMLLVEDVGSLPLFEAARERHAAGLYRLAVDQLLIFHTSGTEHVDGRCIAANIAYDRRLFRWELEQFLEDGITELAPAANRGALARELDALAARLDSFPRVFSHRDYHGQNLFVQHEQDGRPRLRVLDFQDALMAPAAQDLAVLLTTRDAARVITPRIEQRVLDYYYAGLIRRDAARLRAGEFAESYRLCVLQHALKVIGRFTVLERLGKGDYRRYIPYARAQARRMLMAGEFPVLRDVLCT